MRWGYNLEKYDNEVCRMQRFHSEGMKHKLHHLFDGVFVKLRQEGRIRGGVDEIMLRGIGRGRVYASRGDVRRLRRHLLSIETGSSVHAALAGARFRRTAAGGCEAAPAANKPLAFLLR